MQNNRVNNYTKSIGERGGGPRYWFFDDRKAGHIAEARRWLANEEAKGRQVSIYRRPVGLARGYLDAIALVGDFGDGIGIGA